MVKQDQTGYETPMILETFDAHEVMSAAEGLVGQGSVVLYVK